MSDPITLEELEDAKLDAATLEAVINGSPAPELVVSRLGQEMHTLAYAIENIGNDLSDLAVEWNNGATAFTAIKMDVTDIASLGAAYSKLLDLQVDGNSLFNVRKDGQLVISNAAGTSFGGMKRAGNAGEMALTSMTDPDTGLPSEVMRFYWEDANIGPNNPASAAVLKGMGGNRFSIESTAALVHIAANGRFEWEGLVSPRLQFVGYEAGSAIGRPIDFNNYGQTPTRASPVLSVSVANAADDPLHIGTFDGTTHTTTAKFTGTGLLKSLTGGLMLSDTNGVAGFGVVSGVPMIYGNVLELRNSTTSQVFRAYNTYTNASNYERAVFDWSTTANVISIGTEKAGTGASRSMWIFTAGDANLIFRTNNVTRFDVSSLGIKYYNNLLAQSNLNLWSGTSALATTATAGFLGVNSCAGPPTGVPASVPTGQVPLVFDTTNGRLYFYHGGAWHYAAQTA